MPFIACKLPAGLEIHHGGKKLTLKGANIGEDIENVSKNGRPSDNAARSSGYGLTELSAADAEVFADWVNQVTYVNGKLAEGKLAERFPPLENGSILGPFKTIDDARKECAQVASAVLTGYEGLDPKAEGVEEAKDDKK